MYAKHDCIILYIFILVQFIGNSTRHRAQHISGERSFFVFLCLSAFRPCALLLVMCNRILKSCNYETVSLKCVGFHIATRAQTFFSG